MKQPAGHILLNEQVFHYDEGRLHLWGYETRPVEPVDRLMLDCLVRGESEVGLLGRQLNFLGLPGTPSEHSDRARAVASAPGSLLRFLPPIPTIKPEVILLDFTKFRFAVETRELVEGLRKNHRVVHLGLDEHVTGDAHEGISHARQKAAFGESFFAFLQWARSYVRFHDEAVLVFAGSQDAVLFGDFAVTHRSVAILEPGWPGFVSVRDLSLDIHEQVDPAPWLRQLFYAMRWNGQSDIHLLHRSQGSALAALELYALVHADLILMTCANQKEILQRMGRKSGGYRPLGVPRPGVRISKTGGKEKRILVVADHEGQINALEPLFQALASLLLQRVVHRVGVLSHGSSQELSIQGNRIQLQAWTEIPPPLHGFDAAIVVPGMMRYLTPMFQVLGASLPVLYVQAEDAGPLGPRIPSDSWLEDLSDRSIALKLAPLLQPQSSERSQNVAASTTLLKEFDPVQAIARWIPRTEGNDISSAAL